MTGPVWNEPNSTLQSMTSYISPLFLGLTKLPPPHALTKKEAAPTRFPAWACSPAPPVNNSGLGEMMEGWEGGWGCQKNAGACSWKAGVFSLKSTRDEIGGDGD